jgi:hypothetical protein
MVTRRSRSFSSAFSPVAVESFILTRKQCCIVLMVRSSARLEGGRPRHAEDGHFIAMGAAGALVGIVQVRDDGRNDLDSPGDGLLNHWMTFSGSAVLRACAASRGDSPVAVGSAVAACGRAARCSSRSSSPTRYCLGLARSRRIALLAIRNWKADSSSAGHLAGSWSSRPIRGIGSRKRE